MIDITEDEDWGTYIPHKAAHACKLAQETGNTVKFLANGHTFLAYPDSTPQQLMDEYHQWLHDEYDAYLKSPKGQKAQQKRFAQQRENQDKMDRLIEQLPHVVHHEAQLMQWLIDFIDAHNHEVGFNKERVLSLFYQAGYTRHEAQSDPVLVQTNSTVCARWIMANALCFLEVSNGIHQIAKYKAQAYLQRWG